MSDAFWSAMGPVLVALVGGPLVLLVSRTDKKKPDPEPSPERQVIADRYGPEAASSLTDPLVRILADQRRDLDRVEGRWVEARDHVADVHDWIDDGMPSPPGRPTRPPWAPSRRTIH